MRKSLGILVLAVLTAIVHVSFFSQSTFLYSYTHIALLAGTFAAIYRKPQEYVPYILLMGFFLDVTSLLPMGLMTVSISISTIGIVASLAPVIRNLTIRLFLAVALGPTALVLASWLFDLLARWFGSTSLHLYFTPQLYGQIGSITLGNLILAVCALLAGRVFIQYAQKRFFTLSS